MSFSHCKVPVLYKQVFQVFASTLQVSHRCRWQEGSDCFHSSVWQFKEKSCGVASLGGLTASCLHSDAVGEPALDVTNSDILDEPQREAMHLATLRPQPYSRGWRELRLRAQMCQ